MYAEENDIGIEDGRLTTREKLIRWAIGLGMLLFVLLFGLSMFLFLTGEIKLDRSAVSGDRVYMVMERDERGVGWSHTQRAHALEAGGEVCSATTVRYFLWEGDASEQNTRYCECYSNTDGSGSYLGPRDCR